MNKKKHSNLRWFTKVGVVLLYVCFFSVQFCYNYDIANLFVRPSAVATYKKEDSSKTINSIAKADKPNEKKVNIRLNKRFQPVSYTLTSILSIEPPSRFTISKSRFYYNNPSLYSCYLASRQLRGPPIFA